MRTVNSDVGRLGLQWGRREMVVGYNFGENLNSDGRRCKDFDYRGGACDKQYVENIRWRVVARLYEMDRQFRFQVMGVHVSSIPDKDGMYIEVLERDVEVVWNTVDMCYCLLSIDDGQRGVFPTMIVFHSSNLMSFQWTVLYGEEVSRKGLRKAKIVKRVKSIVEMKLLEFGVGDHVMMKLSPWQGVVRFGKKGELAPSCYVAIRTLVWVSKVISSKVPIVKVSWNSKRNFELTWFKGLSTEFIVVKVLSIDVKLLWCADQVTNPGSDYTVFNLFLDEMISSMDVLAISLRCVLIPTFLEPQIADNARTHPITDDIASTALLL
ncbi:hypothetical protein Tco_1464931 [Tanacetum coccineum]